MSGANLPDFLLDLSVFFPFVEDVRNNSFLVTFCTYVGLGRTYLHPAHLT